MDGRHESITSASSSSRSTSLSQSQAGSFVPQHNLNYRAISLIDSIQFKFDGNISKYALVLGDCDNDGKNELLVGTLNGELLIFKDNSTIPIAKEKDLGMISCLVVGDIFTKNKNYIATISIEGYLSIFSFVFEYAETQSITSNRRGSNFSGSFPLNNVKLPPTITDNEELACGSTLLLLHCQHIQANAMSVLIADIDNDGNNELIVSLSDRVVRSYRAIHNGDDMKLVGIHKWEFADQIGSISLSTRWDGASCQPLNKDITLEEKSEQKHKSVLVAQLGGVFAKLNCCDTAASGTPMKDLDDFDEACERTIGLVPEYKNISIPLARNPQISCEIISDIVGDESTENRPESGKLISVATADGLLMLLRDENVQWQCQLEQKIQSLQKHDIDDDGRDELVVCTSNGQTYFVDLDCRIVSFRFDQPVSAFTVGHYDMGGRQMSCLVYGTFTNSIHLYYNIDCSFDVKNSGNGLLEYIRENNSSAASKLQTLLAMLNSQPTQEQAEFKIDSKLIDGILYGLPRAVP